MIQEDKELLLKDLCARLPYGVKISPKEKDTGEYDKTSGSNYMYPDVINVEAFIPDGDNTRIEYEDWIIYLDNIQMYLRPLSSMTEEEKKKLESYLAAEAISSNEGLFNMLKAQRHTTNFLYSRHFDILCLIEKGLALEAPEGMYKISNHWKESV